MELPLLAGRIRILGLVHREQRADHPEVLRFGCSGNVVGNLGSKMLPRYGKCSIQLDDRGKLAGSGELGGLNWDKPGW